jgi:2-iminobutanoate/2-iminopropanoate deaminase
MSAIRRVTSPDAPEPPPKRWSNCLVAGGIAYVAGLTARGSDGAASPALDDYGQAKAIFSKIKALLEAAGGQMGDVVKMTIYVTDIRRREQIWRAREEFFSGDFPTSTLIEVSKLADPAITVEIDAIAHLSASAG